MTLGQEIRFYRKKKRTDTNRIRVLIWHVQTSRIFLGDRPVFAGYFGTAENGRLLSDSHLYSRRQTGDVLSRRRKQ